MSETRPPVFHWVEDQSRAWRLVAAIREHDGVLFDAIVAEAREAGDDAVDKLLAVLSRNLLARLRMSIGMDALDELIGTELRACDIETRRGEEQP